MGGGEGQRVEGWEVVGGNRAGKLRGVHVNLCFLLCVCVFACVRNEEI